MIGKSIELMCIHKTKMHVQCDTCKRNAEPGYMPVACPILQQRMHEQMCYKATVALSALRCTAVGCLAATSCKAPFSRSTRLTLSWESRALSSTRAESALEKTGTTAPVRYLFTGRYGINHSR